MTRALWFETNSFKGVAAEMEFNLAAVDSDERVTFEKVVHRLVVLGVVADYTVNYSANSLDVLLAGISQTRCSSCT